MTARTGTLTRRTVLAALPGLVVSPPAVNGRPGDITAHDSAAVPVAAGTGHTNAAEDISAALAEMICDHCVALSELNRISHRTDAIILGREPTRKEWRRLEKASDQERQSLMRLCAFPATNDAERHAKASCLLALFDGNDPSREHVAAILGSMLHGRSPAGGRTESSRTRPDKSEGKK